ncbi:MAG: DUF5693 family protein [Clostridiales Family XIII bacterium]|nr:DUF5693 family protein [Clostridiales Family XIII bacterium]
MADTKKFIRDNLILLIVITAGLIAGIIVLCARVGVERANKSYDIVADFQEIDAMARQSDQDLAWWLEQFKEMKITKIGLAEESLNSLMRGYELPVSAEVMDLIMQEADWRADYPAEWIETIEALPYDRYDLMVRMGSGEAYDFVTEALLTRYGADRVSVFPERTGGYALIDGTPDMTLYTARYKKQNSKGGGFLELIDVVDSKLMYLSLGMLPEKVAAVQGAGMEVIPRTMSYTGWNDETYARDVIAGYEHYGVVPSYLIVGGESVPGFDDGPEFIEKYLADNNIVIGLIEDTTQLQNIRQFGVLEAVIASDYKTARVFSVWDYIQNRYQYYGYEGVEEIENTLFRAVTERNIRVIYYKPIREFKDLHTYVTELGEYRTLFANLDARLAEHGFSRGDASVMPPIQVPFFAKMLVALASAAAGVLLLHLVFPLRSRFKHGLFALFAICVLGSFKVLPYTTELIASFVNAFVFACLATIFFTARCKRLCDRAAPTVPVAGEGNPAAPDVLAKLAAEAGGPAEGTRARAGDLGPILLLAVATLAGVVVLSLCGGVLTAAPLSSVAYMLEIDIFRGVKLSQLAPIAFFAVAYLAYFGFGNQKRKPGQLEFYDLKEMMNTPIRVWMVLIGLVFIAGGVYYILRTGHEVLEVSSWEMLARNELEELLVARPRTKEFLFAFPAVMLMVYVSCRRFPFWPIVFGLCGVVGVTSVINTFMHIRTPLYLGFARTGYSFAFGLLIGALGILLFELLYRLYKRLEARHAGVRRE